MKVIEIKMNVRKLNNPYFVYKVKKLSFQL